MWKYLPVCLFIFFAGCDERQDEAEAGAGVLRIWAHAGQEAERKVLQQQVTRFNGSQTDIRLRINFIPEQSYNAQVQAAAVAGELPDVLELDGPFLSNYAWQGHLVSLDGLLSSAIRADLLPSIDKQGRYLEAAGVRIPTAPDDAWHEDEFEAALAALAARDADGRVLDLKLNYSGEWFTYAFSPLLQSAGGDLIDRNGYRSADGVLNGPGSVRAMRTLQRWLQAGYVDRNVDDNAFVGGRVAISWAGHWEYPRYAEALAADLVLLPLPDLGQGARTGQGSWVWSITRGSVDPDAAMRFIEFLLRPAEVLAMAGSNGAVPATRTAIEHSPLYGPAGPLHLFSRQLLGGYSVPRPRTPAYPVITSAFQQAFHDIHDGGDVQAALDRATRVIDQDIRDNKGYPSPD